MKHHVAALVFDGVAPFELGTVVEVFGLPRPELDVEDWYELVVCAPQPGPLRAVGGIAVVAEHGLDALAAADTVIVPGWPRVGEPVPPAVVDALRAAHERGARLVSICSGAFVLAATGLLDGREVATHWRYADALRRLHPKVAVNERVLYVESDRLWTSAGSAAGLDLCLALVRSDHGSTIVNHVARRLVLAPHRDGGQAQFIEQPVARVGDDRLGQAIGWALAHLDRPITVEEMAARAFMSPRNFSRRFRAATGATPRAWLLDQRIQASLPLLEDGALPVESVGAAVGFGAPAFRRHFRRALGVSPSQYRRSFRAA
ncbi:MAG TPA: transcriptional regulator FtrA [Solirubrobacteraceae bacterium]|nr:transcriptional regulator FtrA [Solirubrobacteraceae bacterium]